MQQDVISIDPEVLQATPVFRGTRVPIETFFDHLEEGISIDDFLKDFPTVSKEQVIAVLKIAEKILTAKNFQKLYETAA